jgi:hypothetical protein
MVWYFVIETPTRLCPKSFLLFWFWICFYWHNRYLQSVIVELSLQFHTVTDIRPDISPFDSDHLKYFAESVIHPLCVTNAFCAQCSFVTVRGVNTTFLFCMESCFGNLSSSQLDPISWAGQMLPRFNLSVSLLVAQNVIPVYQSLYSDT